ncbi:hypothetical protein CC85DRAFT_53455 [Cutaneotrichosporon oleaginosum]|uniref:Uncharacterized protein n=1 Tax=Cutaneotrichosporon oleaginosum TaxID=879819 RepID=A0A0J0XYF6_9TREE|nr:uncharacterized protein CC85DRAFT_53455 [Cutaneotrichosporon oleaginosum]KLT46071.1 hypothetical protein CC85DRAFT_53455 [Cutaneotrichosporon oleaginosum]TXT10085.1 hypothetical protein COLE_04019 [Cutaneotrichosporon oleaginosum]
MCVYDSHDSWPSHRNHRPPHILMPLSSLTRRSQRALRPVLCTHTSNHRVCSFGASAPSSPTPQRSKACLCGAMRRKAADMNSAVVVQSSRVVVEISLDALNETRHRGFKGFGVVSHRVSESLDPGGRWGRRGTWEVCGSGGRRMRAAIASEVARSEIREQEVEGRRQLTA